MSCFSGLRIDANSKPDSGLQRLLPKPFAAPDDLHILAPTSTSLQNPRDFSRTDASDDAANSAASSAENFGLAQRISENVEQVRVAKRSVGLRNQGDQNHGEDYATHPNLKILIDRVRKPEKPEKRRERVPRTKVACENCRWVVRYHGTDGLHID